MIRRKESVELTQTEIEVIQGALQTQEKILSVQSQASTSGDVHTRLAAVKGALRSITNQVEASKKRERPILTTVECAAGSMFG